MAPSYKVSYFGIRGLAEAIRLLLTDQGIPFVDDRIPRDEWPTRKAAFQFGQVPCLYDGDVQIVQSGAILRHLGRVHGLVGDDELSTTYIDVFAEGLKDLHTKYAHMIYTNYEKGKGEFVTQTLPAELAKIEALFKGKLDGQQFVNGEKVSYADYILFEELDIMLILSPDALNATPALKAFHARFSARPGLTKYLQQRAAAGVPVNGNGNQ